jgi:hypothetical protein
MTAPALAACLVLRAWWWLCTQATQAVSCADRLEDVEARVRRAQQHTRQLPVPVQFLDRRLALRDVRVVRARGDTR